MNIYVGNLSHDVTEDELRAAFEAFGQVESVNIVKDKFTGKPRGFGFVEMPSDEEGKAAIAEMSGKDMKGRVINVDQARPKADNRRGGRGGGGGRGGYGGGGGRRY
ncbi:MAG: RNA-binding protein [Planctomycetota bacterium]|nr:MAG: RNA-binding protein [Planctomycetota bacterium]